MNLKMVWSLGCYKMHVVKVKTISEIISACKDAREFRQSGMFIVKLYNRNNKIIC